MIEGGSRTALLVAAYRGRASARGQVCSDPWAADLAGEAGLEYARMHDAVFPHGELWIAVRTATLDGYVRSLVRSGMQQVVILGAGLDTRAQRLASPGVRFFEVDHPETQALKLRRLGELDYPLEVATYVGCDFEQDDFVERLADEGLDLHAPAAIVWEGVVPYLTRAAVEATLSRVAEGLHPESVLHFDLVNQRLVQGDVQEGLSDLVEGLGEPFRFGCSDPVPMVHAAGFRHIRTISFDEACLSLTGTYDRARTFRFQLIAVVSRERCLDP
ncbi:MAG TPA: class I SAM-dependent methyltransferase [Myxococcota bacterium]|nr:class I SAM-dependent methyltransferase [Myxococcota bacterium]